MPGGALPVGRVVAVVAAVEVVAECMGLPVDAGGADVFTVGSDSTAIVVIGATSSFDCD